MTTFFFLQRSHMAKYLTLMCLLRLPLLLFLAMKITAELSQNILNGLETESTILSPDMKLLNHTPCDVASKQEMNSTSIVEVAVRVCLLLLHDTAPSANTNMYLDVDFRESTQPAKSESE